MSYVGLVTVHLVEYGVEVDVVWFDGVVEMVITLGVVDVIVDVVEIGIMLCQ